MSKSDQLEFVYTYANGQLVSALKNDEGYTYTYDSQGNLIHVEQPIDVNVGNSTVPFTMGFGYDQSGYRNLVIDAFGTRQESIYNYAGRLLVRISTRDGGPTLRIDVVLGEQTDRLNAGKKVADFILPESALSDSLFHGWDYNPVKRVAGNALYLPNPISRELRRAWIAEYLNNNDNGAINKILNSKCTPGDPPIAFPE